MDSELLALPKSSAGEKTLVPPPKSLPLDDLTMWKKLPFDNKYPLPKLPERDTQLYTTKLGETPYHTYPGKKFDLTGTEKHSVPVLSYNPLYDPNLRDYFQSPPSYKSLFNKGLITADGKVKTDITEYNQYRMYLHHLWVMEIDQLRQNQEAAEEKRLQSLLEAVENEDSLCKNIIDNQDIINTDIVMDKLAAKMKDGDFASKWSENSLIRSLINWKSYQKKLKKNYKNDYPALKQWLNDQTKNYKCLMDKKINARKCKDKNEENSASGSEEAGVIPIILFYSRKHTIDPIDQWLFEMRLRWEKLRENSRNSYNRVTKLQEKHRERQRMLSEKRQNLYRKMWNRQQREISERASKMHQKAYPNEETSVVKDVPSQNTSGITDGQAEFPETEDLSTEDAKKDSSSSIDLRCQTTDDNYEWDDTIDNFKKSYKKSHLKGIHGFSKRAYRSSSDQKLSFDSSDTWITTSDDQSNVASGNDTGINESLIKKIRLSLSSSSSEENRTTSIPYGNKNRPSSRKFSSTDNDFLDSSLEKTAFQKKPSKQQKMKKRGKIKGKSTKNKLLSPYETSINGGFISSTTSKGPRFRQQQHTKASKEANINKYDIRTPKRYSSLDADDSSMLLKYLYGLPESPGDYEKIPASNSVQLKEQQNKKPESQFLTECESTDPSDRNGTEKETNDHNVQQKKPKESVQKKQNKYLHGLQKETPSLDEQLRVSDSRTIKEKKLLKPASLAEKQNKDKLQPATDLRAMNTVTSEFRERRSPQCTKEVNEKERRSKVSKPIKDHELKSKQQAGTDKELNLKGLAKDSVEKTEIKSKSPKDVLYERVKPISATAKDSERGKTFKSSRQVNEQMKLTKQGKSIIPHKENGKDQKEIGTKNENGNVPEEKSKKQKGDSEELERKKKFAMRGALKSEFNKNTSRIFKISKSKEISPDPSSTNVHFTSKRSMLPTKTKQKEYSEDAKISKESFPENKISDQKTSPARTIPKSPKKDGMTPKVKDVLKRVSKSEYRKDKGKDFKTSAHKESKYESPLADVPTNVKESKLLSKRNEKDEIKDDNKSKKLSDKDKSKQRRKLLGEYKPESSWSSDKLQERDELKLKIKNTLKKASSTEINNKEDMDSESIFVKDISPETSFSGIPHITKESAAPSIVSKDIKYEDTKISKRLSSKENTKNLEIANAVSIPKSVWPGESGSETDNLKAKDTINYSPRPKLNKGLKKDFEVSSSKESIPETFMTEIPSETKESVPLFITKKEDVPNVRTSEELAVKHETKIHDMLIDGSIEKGKSPNDESGRKDKLKQKAKETNNKDPQKYDEKFQTKDELKKAHVRKSHEDVRKECEEGSNVGRTPEFSFIGASSTTKERTQDRKLLKESPTKYKTQESKMIPRENISRLHGRTLKEDDMTAKDILKKASESKLYEDIEKCSEISSSPGGSAQSSVTDASSTNMENIFPPTTKKIRDFENKKVSKRFLDKNKVEQRETLPRSDGKAEIKDEMKPKRKDTLKRAPKSEHPKNLGEISEMIFSEESSPKLSWMDVSSTIEKSVSQSTSQKNEELGDSKISKDLPAVEKSRTKDAPKNTPKSESRQYLLKDSDMYPEEERSPKSFTIDVLFKSKESIPKSTTEKREDFENGKISKESLVKEIIKENETKQTFLKKGKEQYGVKPRTKDMLETAHKSEHRRDLDRDSIISSNEEYSFESYTTDVTSVTKESSIPSETEKTMNLGHDKFSDHLTSKEIFKEQKLHHQEKTEDFYEEDDVKSKTKNALIKDSEDFGNDADVSSSDESSLDTLFFDSGEDDSAKSDETYATSVIEESASTPTNKKNKHPGFGSIPNLLPGREKLREHSRETVIGSYKEAKASFKEASNNECLDDSKMCSGEEISPESSWMDVLSTTKESVPTPTTLIREKFREDRILADLSAKAKSEGQEMVSKSEKESKKQYQIKPRTKVELKRAPETEPPDDPDKDSNLCVSGVITSDSDSNRDPVIVVAEKSYLLDEFFKAAYQDRKRKVDEELNRYIVSKRDENRLHDVNILPKFSTSSKIFSTSDIKGKKSKKNDKGDEKIHFDLDYNVENEPGSIEKDLEAFIIESKKTENIHKIKENKVNESNEATIKGHVLARKLVENESQDMNERIKESQKVEIRGENLKSELEAISVKGNVDTKEEDGLRRKKLKQTKNETQKEDENLNTKIADKNVKIDIDYKQKDGFAKTKLEHTKHETETIKINEKQDAEDRSQNVKCFDASLAESETGGLNDKREYEYFKDSSYEDTFEKDAFLMDAPSIPRESGFSSTKWGGKDLRVERTTKRLPDKEQPQKSKTGPHEEDAKESRKKSTLNKTSKNKRREDSEMSSGKEKSPEPFLIDISSTTKESMLPSEAKKKEDLNGDRLSKVLSAKLKIKEFERLTPESITKSSCSKIKGPPKDSQNFIHMEPEQGVEIDRSTSSFENDTSEMIESTSHAIQKTERDYKTEKSFCSQQTSSFEKSKEKARQKIKQSDNYLFFLEHKLGSHGKKIKSSGLTKKSKSKVDVYKDVIEVDDKIPSPVWKSPEKLKKEFHLKSKVDQNYFLFQELNLRKQNIDNAEPNSDSDRKREEGGEKNITRKDVIVQTGKDSVSHSKMSSEIKRALNNYSFLFQKPRFRETYSREDKTRPFSEQYEAERRDRFKTKKVPSDTFKSFRKIYEDQKRKIHDDFQRYVLSKGNASLYYDSNHDPEIASVEKSHELEEFFHDAYQDRKRKVDEDFNRYIESRRDENSLDTANIVQKIPTTVKGFDGSDDIMKNKSVMEPYDKNEKGGSMKMKLEIIKDEKTKKSEELKTEPTDKNDKKPVDEIEKDASLEKKSEQKKYETEKKSEKLKTEPTDKRVKEPVDQIELDGSMVTKSEQIKNETENNSKEFQTEPTDKSVKKPVYQKGKDASIETKSDQIIDETEKKSEEYKTELTDKNVKEPVDQNEKDDFTETKLQPIKGEVENEGEKFKSKPAVKSDKERVDQNVKVDFSASKLEKIKDKTGKESEKLEIKPTDKDVKEREERMEIKREKKYVHKIDGKKYLYFTRISIPLDQTTPFSLSKELESKDGSVLTTAIDTMSSRDIQSTSKSTVKGNDNKKKQYELFILENVPSEYKKSTSIFSPEEAQIKAPDDLEFIESTDISVVDHSNKFERAEIFSTANLISHITKEARGLEYVCTKSEPLIKLSDNVYVSPNETSFGKRNSSITPKIKTLSYQDPTLKSVKDQLICGLQKLLHSSSPPLCDLEQAEEQQCSEFYAVCSSDESVKQKPTQLESIMKVSSFDVENRENVLNVTKDFLFVTPSPEAIQGLEVIDENLDWVVTNFQDPLKMPIITMSPPTIKESHNFPERAEYSPSSEKDKTHQNLYFPKSLPDAYSGTTRKTDLVLDRMPAQPLEDVSQTQKESQASTMFDTSTAKQEYHSLKKTLPFLKSVLYGSKEEMEDTSLAISLPDAYYGTECDFMPNRNSTPFNTAGRNLRILDENEKIDVMEDIPKEKQKYHILTKILPPSELQDNIDDIPILASLPEAFYGTGNDINSMSTWTSEPMSKAGSKMQEMGAFRKASIVGSISERKQKFNRLAKILPPTKTEDTMIVIELKDNILKTAEEEQKYHNLRKFLPPSTPKIASIDLKSSPLQTSNVDNTLINIALPDAYYGTASTNDSFELCLSDKVSEEAHSFEKIQKYHTLQKNLPPSKVTIKSDAESKNLTNYFSFEDNSITLPNAYFATESRRSFTIRPIFSEAYQISHIKDKSGRKENDKVDFKNSEGRKKYHILKKFLPPSKFEITDNIKNNMWDDSNEIGLIQLPNAYYGTENESRPTFLRDVFSYETHEVDVSSHVICDWMDKQEYYNLTKVLPPLKPRLDITSEDMIAKNIPLDQSSKFHIRPKFLSLETKESVRFAPFKVSEVKPVSKIPIRSIQDKFERHKKTETLELSQDFVNAIQHLCNEEHEVATCAKDISVLRQKPMSIEITGELLTLLKTLQNRLLEPFMESYREHRLYSIAPAFGTSYENQTWDTTVDSDNYTLLVDATKTDPTILINKSSDPNTTIELNITDFLKSPLLQSLDTSGMEESSMFVERLPPKFSETTVIPSSNDDKIEVIERLDFPETETLAPDSKVHLQNSMIPVTVRAISGEMDNTPREILDEDFEKGGLDEDLIEAAKGIIAKRVISRTLPRKQIVGTNYRTRIFDQLSNDTHSLQHYETYSNQSSDDDEEKADLRESGEELEEEHMREIEKEDVPMDEKHSQTFHELEKLQKLPADKLSDLVSIENLAQVDDEGRQEVMWSQGPSTSDIDVQHTREELQLLITVSPDNRRRGIPAILNKINCEINRIESFYARKMKSRPFKRRSKTEREHKAKKVIFKTDSIRDETVVTADSDSEEMDSS